MKRIILTALILIAAEAWGASLPFGDWLVTYYTKKDDSRLAEFWDRTITKGALEALPESRDILIGFFGAALRGHPELISTRVKSIDQFPEKQRDDIALILWLSDLDCSRDVLRRSGRSEIASTPCPPIKNRKILYSGDAKFLVGWFYATGDGGALSPIVDYVASADWSIADPKADECGAALVVLCERHERVRVVVEQALKRPGLSENSRKAFLFALGEKRANQSPEPTAMSVTPPAAQESRQP
jgi:hypothetical protein